MSSLREAIRAIYCDCHKQKGIPGARHMSWCTNQTDSIMSAIDSHIPEKRTPHYEKGVYTGNEGPFSSSGQPHFNTGFKEAVDLMREEMK